MDASTPAGDPTAAAAPCVSCARVFRGRYCPACGERRLRREDLSARHFVAESVQALTDVDSTLLRTFGALARRPGKLTAEYLAGRRTRYLRPVQVFVLCNILYFFLQPLAGFNPLTLRLEGHLHHLPYSGAVRPMVVAEVARRGIDPREYALLFDATIASQAKVLVFLFIPLFALLLHAAHLRSRRYFAEHLVFATHFVAVFLLLILLLSALLHLGTRAAGVLRGAVAASLDDDLAVALLLAMLVAYLYPALRRVYGSGRLAAALRAGLLAFALLYAVQLYRFILFFTTFHAI